MTMEEILKEQVKKRINELLGYLNLEETKIEADVLYDPEKDSVIITISDGNVSDVLTEQKIVKKMVNNEIIKTFSYLYDRVKIFKKKQEDFAIKKYFEEIKK